MSENRWDDSPYVLGVTGGLCSGKSTVSKILREKGAAVIDADALAHDLLLPDSRVFDDVISEFSPDILDEHGHVDRARLAELVFSSEQDRKRLESIVHPAVVDEIETKLNKFARNDVHVAVLDVPLLYEAGLDEMCDQVWVVYCEPEQQKARARKRDGLSEAEAVRRMDAQIRLDVKAERADKIIDNSGSISQLHDEVQHSWHQLQQTLTGR